MKLISVRWTLKKFGNECIFQYYLWTKQMVKQFFLLRDTRILFLQVLKFGFFQVWMILLQTVLPLLPFQKKPRSPPLLPLPLSIESSFANLSKLSPLFNLSMIDSASLCFFTRIWEHLILLANFMIYYDIEYIFFQKN